MRLLLDCIIWFKAATCSVVLVKSTVSHRLQGVQESGELVEPLRAVGRHPIANEAIELIDVGKTQLIKVLLTLQALNWNW